MRIGVDATCWANNRGFGRFTRELLPELVRLAPSDRFVCLLDAVAAAAFDVSAPNVEARVVRLRTSPTAAASAGSSRSVIDMLRLTRAVSALGADVFFSPSVYTFFPLPPGCRAVVTLHDAIAARFPHLTFATTRARVLWNLKEALALRQARLVLTVSDFAAADISRIFDIPRDRIRVAVEAPAPAYRAGASEEAIRAAAGRLGLPAGARWFVYVGGLNPHKNVDVLVRAHAAAVRALPPPAPHLVLVGPGNRDVFHSDAGRVHAAIDESATAAWIRAPGYLPDDEIAALYAGAAAAVLPSACEGFGLPAVEAAACGAPVVATRESPLPDLLAGGGVFVTPGDVAGLAAALIACCDPATRQEYGRVARTRALQLTWTRTAEATLAALYEAAA